MAAIAHSNHQSLISQVDEEPIAIKKSVASSLFAHCDDEKATINGERLSAAAEFAKSQWERVTKRAHYEMREDGIAVFVNARPASVSVMSNVANKPAASIQIVKSSRPSNFDAQPTTPSAAPVVIRIAARKNYDCSHRYKTKREKKEEKRLLKAIDEFIASTEEDGTDPIIISSVKNNNICEAAATQQLVVVDKKDEKADYDGIPIRVEGKQPSAPVPSDVEDQSAAPIQGKIKSTRLSQFDVEPIASAAQNVVQVSIGKLEKSRLIPFESSPSVASHRQYLPVQMVNTSAVQIKIIESTRPSPAVAAQQLVQLTSTVKKLDQSRLLPFEQHQTSSSGIPAVERSAKKLDASLLSCYGHQSAAKIGRSAVNAIASTPPKSKFKLGDGNLFLGRFNPLKATLEVTKQSNESDASDASTCVANNKPLIPAVANAANADVGLHHNKGLTGNGCTISNAAKPN